MKSFIYKQLLVSFKEWLRLLNFETSTINYAPVKISEFLTWLEKQDIKEIEDVNKTVIAKYFEYLKNRPNSLKGGKLSKNYLRTHITALRKLARYLRETGQMVIDVDIKLAGTLNKDIDIFTKDEITDLYNACNTNMYGIRDRAILAVYYGCGLRRNEGVNLDIDDILFDRNLLYVKKKKNYKERYVPMSSGVRDDLQSYIDYVRPMFIKDNNNALFLGQRGSRLCSQAIAKRLQKLKQTAELEKLGTFHILRHSIATHLLQSGMPLKQIKLFLGHSSLESTQIYTHVMNDRMVE